MSTVVSDFVHHKPLPYLFSVHHQPSLFLSTTTVFDSVHRHLRPLSPSLSTIHHRLIFVHNQHLLSCPPPSIPKHHPPPSLFFTIVLSTTIHRLYFRPLSSLCLSSPFRFRFVHRHYFLVHHPHHDHFVSALVYRHQLFSLYLRHYQHKREREEKRKLVKKINVRERG